MHEFGLIDGVVKVVKKSAQEAHARAVLEVRLRIGDMMEAQEDSLQFAYEVLSEGSLLEGSTLKVIRVAPRSHCIECGYEFEHSRFDVRCPRCNSSLTTLIAGREFEIAAIDIELDEDQE